MYIITCDRRFSYVIQCSQFHFNIGNVRFVVFRFVISMHTILMNLTHILVANEGAQSIDKYLHWMNVCRSHLNIWNWWNACAQCYHLFIKFPKANSNLIRIRIWSSTNAEPPSGQQKPISKIEFSYFKRNSW